MGNFRRIFAVLLVGMIVFLAFETSAFAEDLNSSEAETDRVIVKMNEEDKSDLEDSNVITKFQDETEQLVTLKVPEGETLESFMGDLNEREDIDSVEPDHLMQLEYIPNDPYSGSRQYHHQKIQTNRAWDKTQGSADLTIAVIDDGIDLNHDDLKEQIASFYDVVGKSSSTIPLGDHGTHVAGIISSSIDNGFLGAGVAPNAEIMAINVFSGESAYTSDIIEGVYHAVEHGAEIINLSVGNYIYSPTLNEAIQYAYDRNVLVIAAAGNDSTDEPAFPASYENVISVGSTTANDRLSSFSNYGPEIDITAPGSSIYSTLPGNFFGPMSGTSMASPMVAGVAALIWAEEPQLTNEEVAGRLYSTADDLGSPGVDDYYGNGRLNAKSALMILDLAAPEVNAVNESSREVTGSIPYEIENASVTVYDQSGNKIAGIEDVSGFADFSVAIPQQRTGTVLYVSITDASGNESLRAELNVKDIPPQPESYLEDTSRLGHLSSADVKIYNDYRNKTDYIEAGTNYTHEVYYIKKQVAYAEDLYYLISRNPSSTSGVIGWIAASDLSTHSHVGVDRNAKTFYLNGKGSAYSKAWGGNKNLVQEDLTGSKGTVFKVNLTEKVGNNIWYRGSIGGKTAWVHESFASLPGDEAAVSRLGHLKSDSVRIYRNYLYSTDYEKAGTDYTNEVYYIKKQAEIKGELYYLISRNPSSTNGVVGWVSASDLSTHPHVGMDREAKTFYLNGKGSSYSKAWGGHKNLVQENLTDLKGMAFEVNLTEKVGSNIWYRGIIGGETAWIHESFVSLPGVEKAISRLGHIRSDNVRIYSDYVNQADYDEAGTEYTDEVYYIKKQAKFDNRLYYLISRNPSSTSGVAGWVNASDLSTHPHVGADSKAKVLYLNGKGSAYTKAWGGHKNLVQESLANLEGKAFAVNLTEKVGSNIWYRGVIGGKTAWVHESFVSRPGVETSTSRLGHIRSENVRIYSDYVNQANYEEAGTEYTNEVYYIKKQAEFAKELYYLISRNPSSTSGVVGWVEATDLSAHPHIGVDSRAKVLFLTGKGSAYTKAWGGNENLVIKSLSGYKNYTFKVDLTEKVGSNIWYRGKLNGKTVWVHQAFVSHTSLTAAKYPAPSTNTPGHYVNGVLIVNKKYTLPSNYNPGVNATAQNGVNAMVASAKKQGIYLKPISTFRSYSYQSNLYNNYVRSYGKAEADRFSARPGHSEHQTGLAFDFGGTNQDYWLEESFGETKEGKWLYANAHKFGFVLRYPKGKENITGYMYEPWHYRYIGSTQSAKINNSGLTMEEYFNVDGK